MYPTLFKPQINLNKMPRPKKTKVDDHSSTAKSGEVLEPIKPKLNLASLKGALNAASSTAVDFKSAGELKNNYLPWPNMYLEYLTGTPGIPQNDVVELLGSPEMGKTSLLFTLFGYWAHTMGAYCLHINTETKTFETERIKRLVHPNPTIANEIVENNIFTINNIHFYEDIDSQLHSFCINLRREQNVPHHIPIVVAIDSLTNAAPTEMQEAISLDNVDDFLKAKKEKTSKRMAMDASWQAMWKTKLAHTLQELNFTLILVNGQSTNEFVIRGIGSNISEADNDTRKGGKAMKFLAGFRFTLTKPSSMNKIGAAPKIIEGNTHVGDSVFMKCLKTSHGVKGRAISYQIRFDKFDDTEDELQMGLDFDTSFCNFLVISKVLDISSHNKKFKSESLGLTPYMPPKEFCRKIMDDAEIRKKIGTIIGIPFYFDSITSNDGKEIIEDAGDSAYTSEESDYAQDDCE